LFVYYIYFYLNYHSNLMNLILKDFLIIFPFCCIFNRHYTQIYILCEDFYNFNMIYLFSSHYIYYHLYISNFTLNHIFGYLYFDMFNIYHSSTFSLCFQNTYKSFSNLRFHLFSYQNPFNHFCFYFSHNICHHSFYHSICQNI